MIDDTQFQLDKTLIRQSFEQAAPRYDEVAVLQREVGNRLVERLDWVRLEPSVIADIGCGTGFAALALMKKYRKAEVMGLDITTAMLAIARKRTPWFRKLHCICGDAESLPLSDASCDLVFSNLTLQWCALDDALRECRRVLKPGGLLMFSTLGPDTLIELRRSWEAVDTYNHVNAFIDMHDVGDALLRAELLEPVVDVEHINLTYSDVSKLMRDLKTLGAHNISAGRAQGLTGKGRLRAMRAAYEQFRLPDGLLPATYEIVYGHAWAPPQAMSHRRADGASVFPVSLLRRG